MAMPDCIPPAGNAAHCTPTGLRTWRPAFDALDVQHLAGGRTVLTLSTPQLAAPALFELSAEARDHLVRLLVGVPAEPQDLERAHG